MRKIAIGLLFAVLSVAAPLAARADVVIEGSLGKGLTVKPEVMASQTNIMVAPGYKFSILRLQLGLIGELADVENSNFDLELRPMLTISPPVLPLYGRLIFAVQDLLHYSDEGSLAYGAALGFSISLAGIGVFAEVGVLPTNKETVVVEGRLGASLTF